MDAVVGPKVVCKECSKPFSQVDHLNTHMKSHSGEKIFVCNGCSKDFSTSGNLKRHMRIHSGEKPFVCRECSKCFSDAGDLTNCLLYTSDAADE